MMNTSLQQRVRPRTGLATPTGATKAELSRAFTLTELLVVIIIMVILVSIALPGFRAMIDSSEASRARTSLQSAMRLGRAAAVRSGSGEDVAVVFFYTPDRSSGRGGRFAMVPCVKVAQLRDGGGDTIRDVFVPMRASEPVQMPKGWMVRAYAPANSFRNQEWYGDSAAYTSSNAADTGNWIFPETGFYKHEEGAGESRQTFMVRFAGGTGTLVTSGREALVLDPVVAASWRPASNAQKWMNPETYDDYAEFVRVVMRRSGDVERRQLLGDESTDTILARPVMQLALYEEPALASAIGGTIDADTGCLYTFDESQDKLLVASRGSSTPNAAYINNWIYGDTNFSGVIDSVERGDSPQSILYVIDQYRGLPMAVNVQPEVQ